MGRFHNRNSISEKMMSRVHHSAGSIVTGPGYRSASEACNKSINKTASRIRTTYGEAGHGTSESHAIAIPSTMGPPDRCRDIQRHMIVVCTTVPSTGVGINQNIARLQDPVRDYVPPADVLFQPTVANATGRQRLDRPMRCKSMLCPIKEYARSRRQSAPAKPEPLASE